MKKQLISGTDSVELKNVAFKKAYLLVEYKTASPATGTQGVKLNNLIINLEIQQKGVKKSTSFQGLPAFIKGAKDKTGYTNSPVYDPAVTLNQNGIQIDSLGGLTKMCYVPILTTDYNLTDDDTIKFEVQQLSSLFGSTNISSNVYFCLDYGTDVNQMFISLPKYMPFTTDRTDVSVSLDSVSSLGLINSGNDFVLSTLPVQSLIINSSFYNDNFNRDQQIVKSQNNLNVDLSSFIEIFNLGNKFLQNVQLDMTIDTSLISSGADWFCYDEITPNGMVLEMAFNREKKFRLSKAKFLQ